MLYAVAHVVSGVTPHLHVPKHGVRVLARPNGHVHTVPPLVIRRAVPHAVHRQQCGAMSHASTKAPCVLCVGVVDVGAANRWYNTAAYKRVRMFVLIRDHFTCQIRGDKCTGFATEADHVHELAEGGHPLDPANMRASCRHCNSSRGGTFGNQRKYRTAVPTYEVRM